DLGTLGGARVVDVVDDGADVTHVLEGAPSFGVGETVRGVVDWSRRFDHMQQHTGQHLLSALFEDLCRAPTVSVHFGAASCTLDVDATISHDAAVKVEARANAVVAENRAVEVSFEDAATATGLRKPSDRAGELRIVTIAGIDRSACGGTHVRATGEIGAVLVRRLEKYKQLTRIEFLCGTRAIGRARADYDVLTEMAAALTAGIDDLPKLVASNADAVRTLESERKKLTESLATYRARELHTATTPGADGTRRVVVASGSADELRALAHAVAALGKAVFIGTCDAPLTVMLAASADSGVDAGAALKAQLAAHGGRGGGNPRVAQGTVPDRAALDAVVRALRA
ncbi:MAG TPA: DHHA1 domain-containing protein, partial [Gemmatimonadaceae bacterium]|nr:DHHA1 domain-containing protein [Gemmatimonadaceae bacterium]